jgi:uncharacterized membrane protein YhfC
MQTPQLNWVYIISGVIAFLVEAGAPFLIAIFLARRYQARWRFWLYGALVFFVFQGITRLPVMIYLQTRPAVVEFMKNPAGMTIF